MQIQKTNNCINKHVKMLIYGPSGAGKTTLARTLKDKTLIISCESGLLSLQDNEIDFVDINLNSDLKLAECEERLKNISRIYNFLKDDVTYKNVFIDSISEISQIILDVCEKKYPDQKNSLQKWGDHSKILLNLICKFRDLQKNVIFTCLSKIEKDENNVRYNEFVVYGSVSQKLPQYFDEVFFLHSVKKEDGIIRKLQTENDSRFLCKDRSSKLSLFENPDLSDIINKITSAQ